MPKYQNLSDSELITFLREGDAVAYTEIYDRYFQLMFVFAYKKLRDEELAKDFVQELFVKLWEHRAEIKETESLAPYLYVTLRNKIINYFAHLKVENKYLDYLDGCLNNYSVESDHKVREKQLSDYIEAQIQALPKKMRRIFEMSRKEYYSHREIASILETSENNVTTQIMNALRILKKKLNLLTLLFKLF